MSMSIQFTDAETSEIMEAAARLGVVAEDAARQVVLVFFTKAGGDFEKASEYVLRKNEELYQRLS